MFPWSVFVGLAGQFMSGAASAYNNKRMQDAADAESATQQAYYGAKANEDPLSRSENQHILGQYDRDAERQVERARNMSTITGATPEYDAAVQKAVAEGRSNLMGKMSANASARADYYEHLGENARHNKFIDDQARKAARNQTYANLAANAMNAAGSIIDSYQPQTVSEPEKMPKIETPAESNTIDVKPVSADEKIQQGIAAVKEGIPDYSDEYNKYVLSKKWKNI